MKTVLIAVAAAVAASVVTAWWIAEHVEFIPAIEAGEEDDDEGEEHEYVAWKWK